MHNRLLITSVWYDLNKVAERQISNHPHNNLLLKTQDALGPACLSPVGLPLYYVKFNPSSIALEFYTLLKTSPYIKIMLIFECQIILAQFEY